MTMEPAHAVAAIENALRLAIREVLPEWQERTTREAVAKLLEKAEVEQRKRDGVATSHDLLDYTEFHQLTDLVLGNWDAFKPIFDDKARTKFLFDLAGDYRNPAAHNRELLDFEVELLSGGAGQIRSQVAIFRSMNVDQARFYPKIESAVDNFGRRGFANEFEARDSKMRVDVGDTITIEARAVRARGFEPKWIAAFVVSGAMAWTTPPLSKVKGYGEQITLEVSVSSSDVGEQALLAVILTTDSKHHRHYIVDDVLLFPFAVNPPEDD